MLSFHEWYFIFYGEHYDEDTAVLGCFDEYAEYKFKYESDNNI